jgi:hypothetical protein
LYSQEKKIERRKGGGVKLGVTGDWKLFIYITLNKLATEGGL